MVAGTCLLAELNNNSTNTIDNNCVIWHAPYNQAEFNFNHEFKQPKIKYNHLNIISNWSLSSLFPKISRCVSPT